jgi:hypothetical protein
MSDEQREMPKYECKKIVWALKIKSIELDADRANIENRETDGSAYLKPEEIGYGEIKLSHDYMKKHEPHIGGYYVVYQDGYKSYSPAEPFEDGYKRI